ncbi:MAG TPA: hypothetical protein PLA50_05100 [Bacteroidia bacterium]|nr:hypothetical protein [Bacteroidia bacterium]
MTTYRVHIAYLGREQGVLVHADRHVVVLRDDHRYIQFSSGPQFVAEFPASIVISIAEH